ncbi:rheb-like protein [Desmophyllum pertusum]|uniref:Rheb-like protein n=1 Tax=Desmophyllum pertusum TaxID=174260 RepID=A0A9X0DC29_9CNID|nr:rheb-like protein [Desmophyllum pertusum]
MARFMPRGSIFHFNWQETAEGREFLGGILHRNRRKTFGLLEAPSLPPQLSIETLLGQEIPSFHVETPGIQTSVVYWPAKVTVEQTNNHVVCVFIFSIVCGTQNCGIPQVLKETALLKENQKVVMFKLQFWDCGEHAIRKYDHLLPALKEKADAALFLFSFTDRGSFDDLPNQINRVLDQEDKILQIAVATRYPFILITVKLSDFTEQEIREFEEQWQVPVLRIANVTGKRLADGRSLDGRSGVMVSA